MNKEVNNPSCHFAVKFLSLADCLGLKWHSDSFTHTRGHTHDVVITDFLHPHQYGQVYDHKLVSMGLTFLSPSTIPKHQMLFRNQKRIVLAIVNMDLQ